MPTIDAALNDIIINPTNTDNELGRCPFCGTKLQFTARSCIPPTYYSICPACGYRNDSVDENGNPIANNQEAKADAGKARLTLVPRKIIYDIARIREYGNRKYHNPDNWKQVSPERYRDAMFRHMCAYLDDPNGCDEESGLPHLWHLACNVAFLCEMEN